MSEILRHVIESIGPASRAHAEAARASVAAAGAPVLERLAAALGGAQHTPRPRGALRTIVVVAGDHGCGDPGIALGADHPTIVAATAIADGTAALAQIARAARTPIVLVDAGVREPAHVPAIAVRLGRGPSRDLATEPAMTVDDAVVGLEAGIALAVSLAEPGLDVLAIGAIGAGSEVASAAVLGAATGRPPVGLADELATAMGTRAAAGSSSPIEVLARFGGPDTAVLAGLILGAASTNIAVIIDSYATGAAAVVAALLAPNVTGCLIAAHRGSFTQPAILDHLGLRPIFEVGLGHGEGTGATMVLALVDQVVAVGSRR